MAFLVKLRQSNKCGSVRNDEIINLHLGSGAGHYFSNSVFIPKRQKIHNTSIGQGLKHHDLVCVMLYKDTRINVRTIFIAC